MTILTNLAQDSFWEEYDKSPRNISQLDNSLEKKPIINALWSFKDKLLWIFYKEKTDNKVINSQKKEIIFSDNIENIPKKRQINYNYTLVQNQVFYMDKVIWWADINSFETPFSDIRYSRDEKNVYFNWRKITWADPKTFKFIKAKNSEESVYASDNTNRIYDLWIARDYDFDSFEVLTKFESYDKFWMYFWEENIKITDFRDQKRIRENYDVKISRFWMIFNSLKRNIFWK